MTKFKPRFTKDNCPFLALPRKERRGLMDLLMSYDKVDLAEMYLELCPQKDLEDLLEEVDLDPQPKSQGLTMEQRDTIVQKFVEGYSRQEIAEQMGVSLKTVYHLIQQYKLRGNIMPSEYKD